MKRAIIIAGGTPPSAALIKKLIDDNSIIIAVDSGANCLFTYQIKPDFLIGDLDSIDANTITYCQNNKVIIEKFARDKDQTDATLALEKARHLGINEIVFLGCLGGERADQYFGAFGLLNKCLELNISASMRDESNIISLHDKSMTILGPYKSGFSILAYCDVIKKLSIKNAKFELLDYDLRIGDTTTLSNEFLHHQVEITLQSGKFLLFRVTNL